MTHSTVRLSVSHKKSKAGVSTCICERDRESENVRLGRKGRQKREAFVIKHCGESVLRWPSAYNRAVEKQKGQRRERRKKEK